MNTVTSVTGIGNIKLLSIAVAPASTYIDLYSNDSSVPFNLITGSVVSITFTVLIVVIAFPALSVAIYVITTVVTSSLDTVLMSDSTSTLVPSLSFAVGITSMYSTPNATSVIISSSNGLNSGSVVSGLITIVLVLLSKFPSGSIAVYVT